jgi:hypothetical protein
MNQLFTSFLPLAGKQFKKMEGSQLGPARLLTASLYALAKAKRDPAAAKDDKEKPFSAKTKEEVGEEDPDAENDEEENEDAEEDDD